MASRNDKMVSPREIPEALLTKYSKSGPRYTSYPTAPQFKPDFDRDDALTHWKESNVPHADGLSLYVHLPFCRSRCAYCGCYTLVDQEKSVIAAYLDAVLDNADWTLEHLDRRRPLQQLALGGGTPTFLQPRQMRHLVEGLRTRFAFAPDGERAIEVDPRWVDADYLDLLLELGFNRFSFGVQDLDPVVQTNINRILDAGHLAALMEHLRGKGCEAINLDFIYGLPGQTLDSFAETIRRVVELRPSRIATFGYAHVPWVSPHQKALDSLGIPGTSARMALFGAAFESLVEAGYRHIGMDHFALPEDELSVALASRTLTRNFMGYTTRKGLDLVPLGASSIGAVAGTYVQNHKVIGDYVPANGTSRWQRGFVMDKEDLLRRDVIRELLCNFHLDKGVVEERHGIDFDRHFNEELNALAPFAADKLIEIGQDSLDVTLLGRFFVRNICMTFDTYLAREGNGAGRYSRTI